ncbi:MAG: DUF1080 domain-containing protein, partial [Anaerolineae bacterium]|nr:DUF1080 domain-containing protein [Anaerolineae bacterium]
LHASGGITWNLGALTGAVTMTALITAVVRDDPTFQTYQGASFTNEAGLRYMDDGQNYLFTDSADITVSEPDLHIGKSYVTAGACRAFLFGDNFNSGSIASWTVDSGWSVADGRLQQNGNTADRLAVATGFSGGNYSLSAMLASNDDAGSSDIGLVFRFQNSSNHYRFEWNRGGSGQYRLVKVASGVPSTLGSAAGSAYELNRWYHVEIRAVGATFTVYLDGAPVLSATDAANSFPTGGVGAYASNQDTAYFENFLVTRLDNVGCTVAASDLVTYTLTISNSGQATGHNLVITDAIPLGTSLYTYTFASDDPAAAVTAAPTPIPGAEGNLVWAVNQLRPTTPFTTSANSAVTLTVVLAVSPTIPASSRLTDQASLSYDSQAGAGPQGIQRSYSGGSHSATVLTVDPPGLLKSVAPFTATIGQIVVYTLTVPSPAITAALTTITVTDEIRPNLRVTETAIVANPGLVDPVVVFSGQQVTATFGRIE